MKKKTVSPLLLKRVFFPRARAHGPTRPISLPDMEFTAPEPRGEDAPSEAAPVAARGDDSAAGRTTTNPPPDDPTAAASLLADLQADAASLASAWVAAAADLTDAVAHASAATSSHVGAWDAAADRVEDAAARAAAAGGALAGAGARLARASRGADSLAEGVRRVRERVGALEVIVARVVRGRR